MRISRIRGNLEGLVFAERDFECEIWEAILEIVDVAISDVIKGNGLAEITRKWDI